MKNKQYGILLTKMMLLFLIDSVITYFLPYQTGTVSIVIVPYIGLLTFCLLVLPLEHRIAYSFTFFTGLYYSIVYCDSNMIYVVLFLFAALYIRRFIHIGAINWLEFMFYGNSTISAFELMVYFMMWITNITEVSLTSFLLYRWIPTILFGMVSSLVIFYIYIHNLKTEEKNYDYYNQREE